MLFMGLLQHVNPDAIRATCMAAGGETAEQVGERVAALTAKLGAYAAAAAVSSPLARAPQAAVATPAAAPLPVAKAAAASSSATATAEKGTDEADQGMEFDDEAIDLLVAALAGEQEGEDKAQLDARVLATKTKFKAARAEVARTRGKKLKF
jgi:hypothetical protein